MIVSDVLLRKKFFSYKMRLRHYYNQSNGYKPTFIPVTSSMTLFAYQSVSCILTDIFVLDVERLALSVHGTNGAVKSQSQVSIYS
jgi:hypothetical protein